ncbi:Ig-like domain-containing protein [Konateibacter massiliensis]
MKQLTVDNRGKVTAVAAGTTYITVQDDQGNEVGKIYIRVRN